ncbi:unnamed protein product [Absidia cylindrospora]
MHFSPFATVDDWSRQKPQTADNMFPTSLALPTQPIQQHPATSSAIQSAVSNAPRTTNSYMDGQIQDFMPYQSFQPFDDLTMNHLHQSTKSPSQPSASPQQSQQHPQQHPQQQQQPQLHHHQHHHQLQQQAHQVQHQQHHQQGMPQPSWTDQRYPQAYMPVSTSNSVSMGKPAYYPQHHQQPQQPQQPQQHQQHQHQHQQHQHQHQHQPQPQPQQQQQPHHHHHLHQMQQQQPQSLPPFQQMSYSQQHHMLPHQQAFLHSLNPSQQQIHRHPQYPGLSTQGSPQQRAQHLHYQDQQTGRKRKDVSDYMVDGAVAVPMKKPKKKKKKKEPEDPNAPPKPKRNTGLNKPLILSTELSALMDGEPELSRPEIVKRLWKHIKGNDLQDPKDRRYILCDDKLKTIFQVDRVNSFGMNRDLSKHLTKKEETTEDPSSSSLSSSTTTSTTTGVSSQSSSTATTLVDEPSTNATTTTTTTTTATSIKPSPTITADTPDDVVTPQEGENVHLLNSNNGILTSGAVNPTTTTTTTSSTASSTPSLH